MKPDQTHINSWLAARKSQRAERNETSLLEGLQNGSRAALGQAITLIESSKPADQLIAQQLLRALPQPAQIAKRIGITGVPGVGKSTFIENLGLQLVARGHKVAVLAIDPSSSRTGGSILGDKTRMERLSQELNVFIRPSAAGRTLGGVAKHTREAIALCEAAGYDIILVETVGVGQSETLVHGMVDFFLLLMLAGAGGAVAIDARSGSNVSCLRVAPPADTRQELPLLVTVTELRRTTASVRANCSRLFSACAWFSIWWFVIKRVRFGIAIPATMESKTKIIISSISVKPRIISLRGTMYSLWKSCLLYSRVSLCLSFTEGRLAARGR